jgi:hypothetical protein
MASVPAEVVTVEPDITAPPALNGAGEPVAWSMCATKIGADTGAGVDVGRQIATAMATEAAAASKTAAVTHRRRVFTWAGDARIAPRVVDRRAHTRSPIVVDRGDRAIRAGQSHEPGYLVIHVSRACHARSPASV